MSITAKVIETGEFFWAETVMDLDETNHHDAQRPIDPQKLYKGSLVVGTRTGNTVYVERSKPAEVFKGSDLKDIPENIRLMPIHEKPKDEDTDGNEELEDGESLG
jgi:hypothetical protein